MAVSIKSGSLLSKSSATRPFDLTQQIGFPPTLNSIQFAKSGQFTETVWNPDPPSKVSVNALYSGSINNSRGMRWWEKKRMANMVEMGSPQELVDTLISAGDTLVVVDFYSPGCGGCRALHPKICQVAELNPDTIFLKVNYEELKKTCYALHIHVLPFFRFYRGSKGRLCSFSCTLSTISKFNGALAKWSSTDLQLGLGELAKGLDESELLTLTSIGEISTVPKRVSPSQQMENLFMKMIKNPSAPSITLC